MEQLIITVRSFVEGLFAASNHSFADCVYIVMLSLLIYFTITYIKFAPKKYISLVSLLLTILGTYRLFCGPRFLDSVSVYSYFSVALLILIHMFIKHEMTVNNLFMRVMQYGSIRSFLHLRFKTHYVLDYDNGFRNANNTCLGLTTLFAGARLGFFQKLLGRDGWTDKQRRAILAHERGHSIIGLPCELIEVYFIVSVSTKTIMLGLNIWDFIVLFAIITYLSWFQEIFCDAVSGINGYKLISVLSGNSSGLMKWLYCDFGKYSHPPLILRAIAFVLPTVLGIIAIVVWVLFWLNWFHNS